MTVADRHRKRRRGSRNRLLTRSARKLFPIESRDDSRLGRLTALLLSGGRSPFEGDPRPTRAAQCWGWASARWLLGGELRSHLRKPWLTRRRFSREVFTRTVRREAPKEAGVTLIELLVAVTLVALLSTGMAIVLRVALDGSQKSQVHLTTNRRVIGVERVMREEITNLMPVNTACGEGKFAPLFEGRPQSLRFVSSYSLTEAARGAPHLVEYQVIVGENGVGVRLVMNEILYGGQKWLRPLCLGMIPTEGGLQVPQFTPIQVGGYSFVLADKLAACRFEYLHEGDLPKPSTWTENWIEQWKWPMAVRIRLRPLASNPSILQPTSLTVPVPANPLPGYNYQE
jgi:prepilin-type N-terminal cleavage/methylation domain-containing protein